MPIDVFPELNAPTVVVLTESPGLAADEVEQNVTLPLETSVRGLPGVRRVRSASAIGLSLVWVEFEWDQDIYRARTLVNEKLTAIRELLPPGVHSEITPITSITGEIMLLSVASPDETNTPMELRSYAEFDLRNQLMAVPGVAQVVPIGGELAEYQVHVRHDDLQLYGLSLADVVAAAKRSHTTAGAGYLTNVNGFEIPIRQSGRVRSVEDIRGTVLKQVDGHTVTIGHVAEVQLGATPPRGTAAEGGGSAVVLAVQKSPGTNTLALTDAIARGQEDHACWHDDQPTRHAAGGLHPHLDQEPAIRTARCCDLRGHHPDLVPARCAHDTDHADSIAAQPRGRIRRLVGCRPVNQRDDTRRSRGCDRRTG
jgi:HME family heavy-metal exporter